MDEVERLRRVAYGPGASAAERAEAEAALRRLEARAGEDAAGASSSGGETVPEEQDPLGRDYSGEREGRTIIDDAVDGADSPVWTRSIRVGWFVPIVAGAVIVGIVGTLAVTGHLSPESRLEQPSAPSPSASLREAPEPMLGDHPEAADAWFAGSATASDAYPFGGLLESSGIDAYDVRFALAAGDGWNVWVGRTGTGKLCLLVADVASESGAAGCVEREQFIHSGTSLALNGRRADWYGGEVTVSPVGPAALP